MANHTTLVSSVMLCILGGPAAGRRNANGAAYDMGPKPLTKIYADRWFGFRMF